MCKLAPAPVRRGGAKSARREGGLQEEVQAVFHPELDDVLAAMRSLYVDQLRPVGRILRKRVGELVAAAGEAAPDVNAKRLRNVCDMSDLINVEQEAGGDWSALLVGETCNFVDVHSPVDCYSSEFWVQVNLYTKSFSPEDNLPGGRYACAQELVRRQAPFCRGLSLGQLCHVVQLAISQKRILGHLNGLLVSYHRSQTVMKEHAAECHQPYVGSCEFRSFPLASLQDARRCMQELLRSAVVQTAARVPLSDIKRLFRSRYSLELSETALGHAKLCELFASSAFEDICTVRLDVYGYTIVGVPIRSASKETAPLVMESDTMSNPRRVRFCVDEPLCLDAEDDLDDKLLSAVDRRPTPGGVLRVCNGEANVAVLNTFIHTPPTPVTAVVASRARCQSMPAACGRSLEVEAPDTNATLAEPAAQTLPVPEQPRRVRFCIDDPLCLEDAGVHDVALGISIETRQPTPGRALRVCNGELHLDVRNTFIHKPPTPVTPTSAVRFRAQSMPDSLNDGTEK